MALKPEYEKSYAMFAIFGGLVLALNLYYYAYPMWAELGWTHKIAQNMMLSLRHGGLFSSPYKTKGLAIVMMMLTVLSRHGRGKQTSWYAIAAYLILGCLAYFVQWENPIIYVCCSIAGSVFILMGVSSIVRNMSGFKRAKNDVNETFAQCEKLIETDDSINIPTKFQYQYKMHKGWINCVNPFRASLVIGTPGSGKSFAVYNPFIEQMIAKGYAMFVYDYKYPDLTEMVYNMQEKYRPSYDEGKYGKIPRMCIINFEDPRMSLRCNPLNARYLEDPADANEIATVIMENVAPGNKSGKKDFFDMSATLYVDAVIWFLKNYKNGKYCTFAHVIEIMTLDFKTLINVMASIPELEAKVKPFKNALDEGATDQLQGQIASATIPISGMSSPALYWVLTGDDFTLDINNPDDPKIVCVGNNPDRQAIYGTTLALFTSRMFKLINHKGKRKCGVLLDELPTIKINGIENIIATARSNKVAMVLGAQDKTQLRKDYGKDRADVIFSTVGNIYSGQVNSETAKDLAATFGKEFRERQSQSRGEDNENITTSFQMEEILPQSKIETLTQGTFVGKVADNFDTPIDRKLFCGSIVIDQKERDRDKANWKKLSKHKNFTDFQEDLIKSNIIEGKYKGIRKLVEGLKDEIILEKVKEAITENGECPNGLMDMITSSTLKNRDTLYEYAANRQNDRLLSFAEKRLKESTSFNQLETLLSEKSKWNIIEEKKKEDKHKRELLERLNKDVKSRENALAIAIELRNEDPHEKALKTYVESEYKKRNCPDKPSQKDVDELIDNTGDKILNEYLDAYAKQACDERIKDIIDANYQKVKHEVAMILEDYANGQATENGSETNNNDGSTTTGANQNTNNGGAAASGQTAAGQGSANAQGSTQTTNTTTSSSSANTASQGQANSQQDNNDKGGDNKGNDNITEEEDGVRDEVDPHIADNIDEGDVTVVDSTETSGN